MYKIQTLNAISDVIHEELSAENYLIGKEEFHDSLRRCTDVRSDTVTTANTDDELVQFGVVDPVSFSLEHIDPLELSPEELSESLLGHFDCLFVDHDIPIGWISKIVLKQND